jgi:hypothetical protein
MNSLHRESLTFGWWSVGNAETVSVLGSATIAYGFGNIANSQDAAPS